jgi:hypothetical protein
MRSADNIKKRIKNTTIKTNPQVNKAVLNDLLDRMDRAEGGSINAEQPNIWRMVAKSRIGQIAAVIIVVSAICLVALNDKGELAKNETAGPEIALTTETSRPLSLISLNMTLRYGEIEDVEKQLDMAGRTTKPQRLTIDQLICELDGC